MISVETPGLYSVTVSNPPCEAVAQIEIEPCDFALYLPNAITPSNHDGLNDDFCIVEGERAQIQDFEISIYSRWGELVFHSTDKNFRWDGSVQGRMATNVIYNYLIVCADRNGHRYIYKGSITVL